VVSAAGSATPEGSEVKPGAGNAEPKRRGASPGIASHQFPALPSSKSLLLVAKTAESAPASQASQQQIPAAGRQDRGVRPRVSGCKGGIRKSETSRKGQKYQTSRSGRTFFEVLEMCLSCVLGA